MKEKHAPYVDIAKIMTQITYTNPTNSIYIIGLIVTQILNWLRKKAQNVGYIDKFRRLVGKGPNGWFVILHFYTRVYRKGLMK